MPWMVSSFLELSGQEYWSGLPFSTPRDLPDPGIKPRSPALQAGSCFPGGSESGESTCSVGDVGLISGLGISTGEGNGYSRQYSGLENPMKFIVYEVRKSQTWLSDFHFHFILTYNSQPFPNTSSTHGKEDAPFILFAWILCGAVVQLSCQCSPLCIRWLLSRSHTHKPPKEFYHWGS